MLIITDRHILADYIKITGKEALEEYKKLKKLMRTGKTRFFEKECSDLLGKSKPAPEVKIETPKIAALTVKLYAGDILIRESEDSSLWTMVMGEILEKVA